MLFSDPSPTPYDVRFELLGFPVRIHPGFWVVSLLLGIRHDPRELPVWMGVVAISILVHEIGHALVQRAFGGRPWIVLYIFGGYAATQHADRVWWRNVLVALAGPVAGLLLAAIVFGLVSAFGWPLNHYAGFAAEWLLMVNVAWSAINLAPIWPLDGGQVARELLVRFMKASTGVVVSLWLSIVSAALVAVLLWIRTESLWNLILFGMLGYQSYRALEGYQRSRGAW